MTLELAREGIKRCTDKLNELRPQALAKRREHLTNRLNTARQQDNEKKVKEIERVMQREEGLQKWGRIGCATKKRRTKAASRCAVIDENGQRNIILGKEPFENAAAKYIDERY